MKGSRVEAALQLPKPERTWTLREAEGWQDLASALSLDELPARLLASRGVHDPDLARLWLGGSLRDLPDPRTLIDMEPAVERVLGALDRREPICVHGDYDVDGCTSTAVLVHLLRDLGGNVSWYAPHRQRDGYGIALHTVDRLGAEGVQLMITCDTGVSAHAAIDRAREHGIEVVVCDHHTLPAELPQAVAILNPKRDGEDSPFAELAAVGVAFMLAIALRARMREDGRFNRRPEPDLRHQLDVVALGTVADLAPLRGINRILVNAGLRVLARRQRVGLRALLEVSGVRPDQGLDASHLGFRLGPRINAAGRLDEAARSVELLLADDIDVARDRAEALDAFNRKRQQTEREILADALKQASALPDLAHRKGLVLWSESWHPGVVGIVAARIVQAFHKPTLVLALRDGMATGSGRTIRGVNLYGALERCDSLMERWGGHRAAAGLTISEARLPDLLEQFAGPAFEGEPEDAWQASLSADAELPLTEVTWDTWNSVQRLAPFGIGNPEPVFIARGLQASGVRALNKGGIRMNLRQGNGPARAAVGFGLGVAPHELSGEVEAAFCLQENVWRGERKLELRLRDVRAV